MKEDLYRILGVSRQASAPEIRRAYYRLAKRWHPDVSSARDANARFQRLNQAYHILIDPRKRRLHDAGLDQRSPVQQQRDYYRYGTSVKNPSRESKQADKAAHQEASKPAAAKSFIDHLLFATLLFLGLTAFLYGILDAILKDPDDGSRYYGLVLGIAFTALLLLGWNALRKEGA